MVKFEKKGAVELSLNLIIMLVIGLTVMGLVIAFVTNFLGSAEDSFTGSLSEDDRTKIQQVVRESGNFAFLESTISVIQGNEEPAKLYMKVRNPAETPFDFQPTAGLIDDNEGELISVIISEGRTEGTSGQHDIEIYGPPIVLQQGQTQGYPLEVYSGNTDIGTYYATFTINFEDGSTESTIVTIRVE